MTARPLLRRTWARLRAGWLPVAESTAAATAAWLVATGPVGHRAPFFAPAAALIVLGQVRGQRVRRAVEVLLGVAGGVLVADLVARALGPHQTWTVLVVIALTLTTSVAVGASTVFLVQAAVSALYVAVVTPPGQGSVPVRFVDALVGGAVALAVSQLVAARQPLRPLARQARAACGELAEVLDGVGAALASGEEGLARAALARARRAGGTVDGLRVAVDAAGEALLLRGRERRGGVLAVGLAARQADLVVRNIRVLARSAVAATRLRAAVAPALVEAVADLAVAVRLLGDSLVAALEQSADAEAVALATEEAALRAVAAAGRAVTPGSHLAVMMVVGQLRAAAVDVLRANGGDELAVLNQVDAALGLS